MRWSAQSLTVSLLVDHACKKRAGHAASHVTPDDVTPRVDAEDPRRGRSLFRVMDRGVSLFGFHKATEDRRSARPKTIKAHHYSVRVDVPGLCRGGAGHHKWGEYAVLD